MSVVVCTYVCNALGQISERVGQSPREKGEDLLKGSDATQTRSAIWVFGDFSTHRCTSSFTATVIMYWHPHRLRAPVNGDAAHGQCSMMKTPLPDPVCASTRTRPVPVLAPLQAAIARGDAKHGHLLDETSRLLPLILILVKHATDDTDRLLRSSVRNQPCLNDKPGSALVGPCFR